MAKKQKRAISTRTVFNREAIRSFTKFVKTLSGDEKDEWYDSEKGMGQTILGWYKQYLKDQERPRKTKK